MNWRHALISLASFAILAVAAAVFILAALPADVRHTLVRALTPGGGPGAAIEEYLQLKVSASGNYSLEIGGIGGSYTRGFVARDVRLDRRNGATVFEADSIVVRFAPRELLRDRRIRYLAIARPRVDVAALRDSTHSDSAKIVLPTLPIRSVDSLLITRGSVSGLGGRDVASIDLRASLALDAGVASLRIPAVTFAIDSLLASAAGTLAFAPDSLRVAALDVTAGGSRFHVDGAMATRGHGLALAVVVDTLRFEDVALLVPKLDRAGGASGVFSLSGPPQELLLAGTLRGEVGALAISIPYVRLSKGADGLVVDSLLAESGGARVRGSLRLPSAVEERDDAWLEFTGVDIREFAPDSLRLPPTDLSGRVSWSGTGRSYMALDGNVSLRLSPGRVRDIPFDALSLDGRIQRGAVEAGRLEVRLLGGSTTATGWIAHDGDFDLDANAAFGDLSRVGAFANLPSTSGRAQFNGSIARTGGELLFDGALEGANWRVRDYTFDEIAANGTYALRNGERTVVAQGSVLGVAGMGQTLGGARASIRYENRHLYFEEVAGMIGDVGFEARGDWTDDEPADQILITSFAVTRDGVRTEHPDPIELWKEGNRVGLLPVHIPFHGGELVASGEYDAHGEREARVLWNDLDLSDVKLPAPLSSHLLDRTDLSLSVSHSGGVPQVRLRASGDAANADTAGFVSFTLTADHTSEGDLDVAVSLAGTNGGSSVAIVGTLADSLATRLSSSTGSTRERLWQILRPDVTLRADSLPIAWIRDLSDDLAEVGGALNADWRLFGDPKSLSGEGLFSLTPLIIQGNDLGPISGRATLADTTLALDIQFNPDWGASSGAVRIPARLDLTRSSLDFNMERPLSLSASIPRGDLGLFPLIVDETRRTRGEFSVAQFEGRGTLAAPQLFGEFVISNGRTYLRDLAESFEAIEGRILLQGDTIRVDNLTARSGEEGTVRVDGIFGLTALDITTWDLTLTLRNFYLESIPGAAATINADIRVGTAVTSLGEPIPHLTGTIDILGGVVDQDFTQPGQATPLDALLNLPETARQAFAGGTTRVSTPAIFQPTSNPPFTCEIDINVPRDFWIANKAMDVELFGDATLFRSERGLGLVGSLESLRGTYSLIGSWIPTQLRIEEGEIFWSNPDNALFFSLNARATTEAGGEQIEMSVTGPIDSLSISATSETGKSYDEILQLLATQTSPGNGGSSQIGEAWLSSFSSLLSRELLRGVSPFDIGVEYVGGETQVSVGRTFLEDIDVTYSQRLGSDDAGDVVTGPRVTRRSLLPDRELRVEYKLSRNLFFEGLTGSLRDGTPFANLDLKARVGY
ncbi:MAG: translocation/assembly module TamB domain-containing protein [bacterium]